VSQRFRDGEASIDFGDSAIGLEKKKSTFGYALKMCLPNEAGAPRIRCAERMSFQGQQELNFPRFCIYHSRKPSVKTLAQGCSTALESQNVELSVRALRLCLNGTLSAQEFRSHIPRSRMLESFPQCPATYSLANLAVPTNLLSYMRKN
jgi:hypothetical protein